METGYVGLTLKLRDTGKVWEPRTASGGSGCQVRSWQVTHRPQRRGSRPEEDKRGLPLDRASLTRNELCPTRKKPIFRTTNTCRRARWKQNWEEMIQKERQWLTLNTHHSDEGSLSGDVSRCWTGGRHELGRQAGP